MLEIGLEIIKVLSIIVGVASGAIAVYITSRLAPIARQLDKLEDKLAVLNKDRELEDSRLGRRIDANNSLINRVSEQIPNCAARQAEIYRDIGLAKAELRMVLLEKLMEVSEANIAFRDTIKDQLSDQTSTWSRETITREAVEKLNKDLREDMRRETSREIQQLEARLG